MRPTSTELLAKTCAWGDDRLSAPPGTIHAGRVRGGLQELQLRMEGSSQAHEVRPLRSKTRSNHEHGGLYGTGLSISGESERHRPSERLPAAGSARSLTATRR